MPRAAVDGSYVEITAQENDNAARLRDGFVVRWGDSSFLQEKVPLPGRA
jgi:hypothetical protein